MLSRYFQTYRIKNKYRVRIFINWVYKMTCIINISWMFLVEWFIQPYFCIGYHYWFYIIDKSNKKRYTYCVKIGSHVFWSYVNKIVSNIGMNVGKTKPSQVYSILWPSHQTFYMAMQFCRMIRFYGKHTWKWQWYTCKYFEIIILIHIYLNLDKKVPWASDKDLGLPGIAMKQFFLHKI